MDEPSSHIAELLSLLEKQEEEYQSLIDTAQLKNHILCLKLGFPFLGMFLEVSTNEDLKSRIERVLYEVTLELDSLSDRPVDGSLILDVECVYTNLQEKMKNVIIKPSTQEYDVIFLGEYFRGMGFHLKQINDFLLQISGDLLSSKADWITTLTPEIEGIKELLILLQPLHTYLELSATFPGRNKMLRALVDLLDKAACLLYICLVDKMNKEMALDMKHKLSDLLEMTNVEQIYIGILRASDQTMIEIENWRLVESYFLHRMIRLLDWNARYLQYLNDPSKKLHDELKFLHTSICDLPRELTVANSNYLMPSIQAVVRKSIPILYSCHVRDMKEDMARRVNSALSEVLDLIEHIQEDGFRCITLCNYPKIGGLSFLDHFLGHLKELLTAKPELRETAFGTLHKEFDSLMPFLRQIEEQHDEHEELSDIWTRVVGLAYQAEYVVDLYLLPKQTFDKDIIMLSLSKIIKQAMHIKAEVKSWICDEEKDDHKHPRAQDVARSPSGVPAQAIEKEFDDIVGFEEDATKIMDYLVGNQQQLDFISITGMPGIGKTTLAEKMYDHPSIVNHFDVRAWVTVSQTYQKTKLLKTILGDLIKVADDKKESNNEKELAECLFKTLKGRRYLIVFDDIWDLKAWNEVQRCFPNDNIRSRILITTRHQNVASNIKEGSKVHTLGELTEVESWEMFQKNLKPKESFSGDFLQVGNRIVQSCKGLPLAIVVIARLLTKVEKCIYEWDKISKSLTSHIFNSPESPCMAILELSYSHLPDCLKSCFLYFGAFPEDAVIPVQKLKQLWIAEGFVCNNETKNLEDVAEEYFKDLISRSLVITAAERSLEGPKACCIHDLLHEFCLKKAKEESFLQWKQESNYFGLSEVYNRRLIVPRRAYFSASFSVHSLFHISTWVDSWDISFICKNFKLLIVLDLCSKYTTREHFEEIGLLIHLRYLAIDLESYYVPRGFTSHLPSTISRLSNLQYFFWKARANEHRSDPNRIIVPPSLWNIGKLRHVYIYPCAYFFLNRIKESSAIDNLEKLSTACSPSREALVHLSRLPKLQKLSCIFEDKDCTWDESNKLWRFPELDLFCRLASLKVRFNQSQYRGERCVLKFPSHLQKLTLLGCRVFWEDISRMGTTLPNLKVLKIDDAYWKWAQGSRGYINHDATWNVNYEDFPELKYLKLSSLTNFGEWIASDDSFPKLEQLVLESCSNLKEIPPCFGGSNTLQKITVRNCRASVEESALCIQKEQEEMGNEQLKLYLS